MLPSSHCCPLPCQDHIHAHYINLHFIPKFAKLLFICCTAMKYTNILGKKCKSGMFLCFLEYLGSLFHNTPLPPTHPLRSYRYHLSVDLCFWRFKFHVWEREVFICNLSVALAVLTSSILSILIGMDNGYNMNFLIHPWRWINDERTWEVLGNPSPPPSRFSWPFQGWIMDLTRTDFLIHPWRWINDERTWEVLGNPSSPPSRFS